MKSIRLPWLLFAYVLLVSRPVAAEVVSFHYTGAFTFSDYPGVNVGDPFSGSFTYDTSATDDLPADPNLGLYPLISATFTTPLGTDNVGAVFGNILQIDLTASPTGHELAVVYNGQFGAQGYNHQWRLTDSSGTVFPNDSPPASLALGNFDQTIVGIQFFGQIDRHAYGPLRTLTQVAVPEPAALSLFAAGMLGVGLWHARRREHASAR